MFVLGRMYRPGDTHDDGLAERDSAGAESPLPAAER
jgi:AAHS family 4-hydroxybenzoate transporter-like MFS transporter